MSDLITSLDAEGLYQILSCDEDFDEKDVEIVKSEDEEEPDVLLLTIAEDCKLCFNFLDDNDLLVLTLSLGSMDELGINMDFVNMFNMDSVYATAFVDDENDLILRSSLSLRGGVAEASIPVCLENFSEDLDLLQQMLEEEVEDDGDDSEDIE